MELSRININLIVALDALLREKNVTRAAKRVGLGQSSMSHALMRLRAHFGDPLLVQVGRKMVLTERAKALTDSVHQAVAKLEGVFALAPSFDPASSKREFTIASTDNLELYVLPKLLSVIGREAPNVSLRSVHLASNWAEALRTGEIDLKLGRKYKTPPGLCSEDLLQDRLTCVVGKHHPLTRRRLTLAQYAALRHLVVTPTSGQGDIFSLFVDDHLRANGMPRRAALSVSHFVVAPMIVAATDLCLTAAERLVTPFERPFGLRRLELPFAVSTYWLTQVWAQRSNDDAGHLWLRQTIARTVASPRSD
jgi:DNA-binding transcriptional LysR family regulator